LKARRLRIALAVVAAAVGLVLALRPADRRTVAGKAAPAFETFDLAGNALSLRDYSGKVVIINFWASWCIPCRKEFPLLKQIQGPDVAVLGVVYRDSKRAAAGFMREQGATWPGLIDPEGQIAKAYGVGPKPGIPVTFVVDAKGNLVKRHIGELRKGDLEGLVAAAKTFNAE